VHSRIISWEQSKNIFGNVMRVTTKCNHCEYNQVSKFLACLKGSDRGAKFASCDFAQITQKNSYK